ncbi:MAG: 50S ribosomal protein L18 [Rickettsiales bacterium]|jgi:large subunit ribosomal protein L18|nr:50S ribosomal protein L18 [Rickettsiales bacterium]
MKKKLLERRKSRNIYRIREHNRGNRPVLNVFRSNKHIYAQIVDSGGRVLTCASSKTIPLSDSSQEDGEGKSGIGIAGLVGEELAKNAVKIGLARVVFNKGPYLYAGRVRSLAEAARKNGLDF